MTIKDGGPAFPIPLNQGEGFTSMGPADGMTLRQYAAIKLRVPESGDDWLDDMIRKSLRDEFAAKAMQSIHQEMADDMRANLIDKYEDKEIVGPAYDLADAMLRAREQQP